MKLKHLQLENFRNYQAHSYSFELEDECTILVGENGLGKTNFLESIYLLSLGKSFRTNHPENLIKWEEDFFRCKAEIISDGETTDLEVFYSHKPRRLKSFKKNNVKLKNSEYLGNLLTVLFHPEDLNMLYLSPSYRRKYLDIILSQTSKLYLDSLSKYNKVLKQRNKLLHHIRDSKVQGKNIQTLLLDLDAWDQQLNNLGSEITLSRLNLLNFLAKEIEEIYRKISDNNEELSIRYQSNILKNNVDSVKNLEEKQKRIQISALYKARLKERRELDIMRAKSNIGPHRDDIEFKIDQKIISKSASRGEFRTLLLAIKLTEISYIKQKTSQKPLLLLDDVFSELDPKRQKHLLSSIQGCQTIITTTEVSQVENLLGDLLSIRLVKM